METTLGTREPADVRATSGLAGTGTATDHDVPVCSLCQHRGVSPTVLVVDDHAWFRTAVSALLGAEGFTVVGEAGDGDEALAMTGLLHPEVVLLISSRTASDYGDQVAGSPARGFLDKGSLSGAALTRLLR